MNLNSTTYLRFFLIFIMSGTVFTITAQNKENIMYVWYGDNDLRDADFVATVNFNPQSANYGKIISVSPLRGAGSKGNEPHHIGLVKETNTLVVGGLLSLLKSQDEVFFYDISNPLVPVYKRSFDVPLSSTTDEFVSLPNGNFLVTMMGGATGGQPGRVAEFNPQGKLIKEWPTTPPTDGFNPHGISVRPEKDIMVTCDFVNPISTITGDLMFPNKVRVWKLSNRTITKTIDIPDAGATMDLQLIPNDPQERAILPGFGGKMWLIDTKKGTAKSVYDFKNISTTTTSPQPHIVKFSKNGKRMFISLYASGQVAMFNSENPEKPVLLSVINLGSKSGIHYIRLTEDETRIVASGYFLNQRYGTDDVSHLGSHAHTQAVGVVEADGDRKVHVINIKNDKLSLDTRFKLDGNIAFATGPARPHGFIFNYSKDLEKEGTCDAIKVAPKSNKIEITNLPDKTTYIQLFDSKWRRTSFINGYKETTNGTYTIPVGIGNYILKLSSFAKDKWCDRTFYVNVYNTSGNDNYSFQSTCNDKTVDISLTNLPTESVNITLVNSLNAQKSLNLGKQEIIDEALNLSVSNEFDILKMNVLIDGIWQERIYKYGMCDNQIELLNSDVTVFPNPAETVMNIDLSAYYPKDNDKKVDVTINNSLGQVVIRKTIYLEHQRVVQFNTEGLPSGIYQVKTEAQGVRPIMKSFIISK